jgi:hypothetical protein
LPESKKIKKILWAKYEPSPQEKKEKKKRERERERENFNASTKGNYKNGLIPHTGRCM